jgi:hypothetical protein
MNWFVLAASILTVLVGVVHSVLGEIRIFSRLTNTTLEKEPVFKRQYGILWASWHFLSVLGWGFAVVLFWLGTTKTPNTNFVLMVVACVMAIGSVLVFIATKARHLGWVGLLAVSLLLVAGLVF